MIEGMMMEEQLELDLDFEPEEDPSEDIYDGPPEDLPQTINDEGDQDDGAA